MLPLGVCGHDPWLSGVLTWTEQSGIFRTVELVWRSSYHHDPDQEEGVADQDDEAGEISNKVPLAFIHQRTVFYFYLRVVKEDAETQPYHHVQRRHSCNSYG